LLSETHKTEALAGSNFPRKLWPYRAITEAITEINTIHKYCQQGKGKKKEGQLQSRVPLSTDRVIRLTVERCPNEGRLGNATSLSQRGWQ